MSEDEHKCHCSHVVILVTDHRRISWAVGLLFALLLGFAFHELTAMDRAHIRASEPMGRDGERLAPDRVEEPSR